MRVSMNELNQFINWMRICGVNPSHKDAVEVYYPHFQEAKKDGRY